MCLVQVQDSSSRFICHIHDYTESINQQWNVSNNIQQLRYVIMEDYIFLWLSGRALR